MLCRCFSLFLKFHCLVVAAAFGTVVFAPPRSLSADNSAIPSSTVSATAIPNGLIQHIVIIMQENRTFDHYFGTYPGAKGIPLDSSGVPTLCVPDPLTGVCMRPYNSPSPVNYGGPHGSVDSVSDINNGKMDGFIARAEAGKKNCGNSIDPQCMGTALDVMGYHTRRELPNYWAYADNFVLQDNLYEPVGSYSLPAHLFMVSGWSAWCKTAGNPMSCTSNLTGPSTDPAGQYGWTDITYLLHKNRISWKYYIEAGPEPDCEDGEMECAPGIQGSTQPGYWNPLPLFATVQENNELGNIVPFNEFFADAANGTLPQVSWIVPNNGNSEHPPNSVLDGQTYVTGLINAIMTSPNWATTAIFLSWDDWGGFYDHANPPTLDVNGYGIRVPGLVISPYAKHGFIDHQILSHDAYLKFIEDVFLNGQRIDPASDERPDSRPNVRENAPILGDLVNDFDFTQSPRPPMLLYQYFHYPSFAYLADGASNSISGYAIDWNSGELATVPGSPFATGGLNPASIAHDPGSHFLFVASSDSNTISAFAINQSTGALTPVPGSPFSAGGHPVALSVDSTGGYLFSLNSQSCDLWTYVIRPTSGVLTKLKVTPLASTDSPTQLVVDNSGRFLYVASSASQQIVGFIFNNSNGNLTSMAGSPFSTGASAGPIALATDREGRWLFSSDDTANTISQFSIQYAPGNAGTPSRATVSMGQSPGAMTFFNSARSAFGNGKVFAINRASHNLAAFSVASSGTISPLTNSPYAAGTNPSVLGADQWDGYLYIAGTDGIWAFKIGQTILTAVKGSPFAGPNLPQAMDIIYANPVAQYALATSTTISTSANPSVYGQPVAFTAQVKSVSGAPTGGTIISFNQGDSVLGTGKLWSGVANFTTSTLTPGTKLIKAVYRGDAHLPPSTSATISQVVNKAPTTLILGSSANPSPVGQRVTFSAKVAVRYGAPPGGTVVFQDGTTVLGSATLTSGTASFSTANLALGSHAITAIYKGVTYYLPCTSSVVIQGVQATNTAK